MRGTWHLAFAGIPFAKCWMAVEEQGGQTRFVADFKSTGLIRVFKRMKSFTEGLNDVAQGAVQSREYRYTNKDEEKYTLLRYDAQGALQERVVDPEDDPWHRPPVKAGEVSGAVTPGDLLFQMPLLMEGLQKGNARDFLFYEGKRLARIRVAHLGTRSIPMDGKPQEVIKVLATRDLVSGYTDKEIRRYQEGDAPLYLYLRTSDFFPLAAELPLPYGTVTAQWEAEVQEE
jgi:hypothetical protein